MSLRASIYLKNLNKKINEENQLLYNNTHQSKAKKRYNPSMDFGSYNTRAISHNFATEQDQDNSGELNISINVANTIQTSE